MNTLLLVAGTWWLLFGGSKSGSSNAPPPLTPPPAPPPQNTAEQVGVSLLIAGIDAATRAWKNAQYTGGDGDPKKLDPNEP